jgi:hypothetical protein
MAATGDEQQIEVVMRTCQPRLSHDAVPSDRARRIDNLVGSRPPIDIPVGSARGGRWPRVDGARRPSGDCDRNVGFFVRHRRKCRLPIADR